MNPGVHATPSLFEAVRRFWFVVLGFSVLAAGAGFIASGLQPTKYEATAEILVDPTQDQSLLEGGTPQKVDPVRSLLNQVARMRSPEILKPAGEKLGGEFTRPEVLASHVRAASAPDLDLLRVTGIAETADESARIANAVVDSYTELIAGERKSLIDRSIALQENLSKQVQAEIGQVNARLQTIQQETTTAVQRVQRFPTLVADEVARQLRDNPEYQQLTAQRNANIETINMMARKIGERRIDAQLLRTGVNVFEVARPPLEPVQPKPTRNAALAAVLGLLGGAGLAWWQADRLAPAGTSGTAGVLGAPELGELPAAGSRSRRLPVDLDASSPVAAGGRLIAAALSYRMSTSDGRTVLVTGLHGSSGRTLTVLAIATAVARTGRTVLVIDADPGEGGLSTLFAPQATSGLDDLVRGRAVATEVIVPVNLPGASGIDLLPAGSAPLDLLAQGAAEDGQHELAAIAEGYDLVLVDAPPLFPSPVALELSRLADALILVLPADVSAGELARARDRMQLIGARVAGFVSNRHGIDGRPLRVSQEALELEPRRPVAVLSRPASVRSVAALDLEAIIRETLGSSGRSETPSGVAGRRTGVARGASSTDPGSTDAVDAEPLD